LEGGAINQAKAILAYELTKSIHGESEARQAQAAAQALFGGGSLDGSVPTTEIAADAFSEGMNVIDLLEQAQIIASRGEGRRLIQQGGLKINEAKIASFDHRISAADFREGVLMIQKGKKGFHRIVLG
jgi:tyrosyl-tRNA synthetase